MKTEKQIRDFLACCDKVRDFGMSKGNFPLKKAEERVVALNVLCLQPCYGYWAKMLKHHPICRRFS